MVPKFDHKIPKAILAAVENMEDKIDQNVNSKTVRFDNSAGFSHGTHYIVSALK